MGKKALMNVSGLDADGNPYSYAAGDEVSGEHAKLMAGNPHVFGDQAPDDPFGEDGEGGDDRPQPASLKADWEKYADSLGIDTDGMTKDEIVAAVDAADPQG